MLSRPFFRRISQHYGLFLSEMLSLSDHYHAEIITSTIFPRRGSQISLRRDATPVAGTF